MLAMASANRSTAPPDLPSINHSIANACTPAVAHEAKAEALNLDVYSTFEHVATNARDVGAVPSEAVPKPGELARLSRSLSVFYAYLYDGLGEACADERASFEDCERRSA